MVSVLKVSKLPFFYGLVNIKVEFTGSLCIKIVKSILMCHPVQVGPLA